MNKIYFPQGALHINDRQPVKEIAFSVCGGRKPASGWLKMTVENLSGSPKFFAADKGMNYYHVANLIPDIVIGDGDSADPVLWKMAEQSGRAVTFPVDKDETDFQLLLENLPSERLWIFSGVFGGRLDHLLSLLETMGTVALKEERTVVLADEREIAVFVPEGVTIDFYPPKEETPVAVSVLSFTEKSKVSISGTKWQLEEKELMRNHPYAISNEMSEAEQIKELPHIHFTCHTGMTVFYIAG